MRIDSHAHGVAANLKMAPKEYVEMCEKNGISAVVLIQEPETVFASKAKMGSFVIPVPIIEMDQARPEEVHRLFDQGAKGIKFFLPKHPYGDERYFPLYEAIRERDGVAVFHTGYVMHDKEYSARWRVKLEDMRSCHMDTIARWVPGLRMLMSHFGNPYWEECWKVMWAHEKVYADLSGGTAIVRSMLFWREMFAPNGQLLEDCMGKLCFGTDMTYFGERLGVELYIRFYERLYEECGATEGVREKINAGNLVSLFKVEGV